MSSVEITFGEPVIIDRVPAEEPGFLARWWGGIEATAEEWTDKAMYAYSKTDVSAGVDTSLATAETAAKSAQASIDAAKASANKFLGYVSDPEKLEGVLTKVFVIVIILGIVYVLAMVAPLIPRGAR